jgi:hypothetical protein
VRLSPVASASLVLEFLSLHEWRLFVTDYDRLPMQGGPDAPDPARLDVGQQIASMEQDLIRVLVSLRTLH